MGQETLNPQMLMERMTTFMTLGSYGRVNSFRLLGPREKSRSHTLVGYFPHIEGIADHHMATMHLDDISRDPRSIHRKILGFTLPDRIQQLPITGEVEIKKTWENYMALNGMPTLLISLGKTEKKKEQVAVLYAIAGLSPQQALNEIQEACKTRLFLLESESTRM